MRRSSLSLVLLTLFALLSVADLGLTWFLIRNGGGAVYEGNPVAGWWLEHYGWLGLTGFKLGQIVLVAALGLLISRWRPRVGSFVLGVASAVVACVVLYSVSLAHGLGAESGDPTVKDLVQLSDYEHQLNRGLQRGEEYRKILAELSVDLAEARIDLAEGTELLAQTEQGRAEDWKQILRLSFPGLSDRECLGANLTMNCLALFARDTPQSKELTARLKSEYRSLFGRELPRLPSASLEASISGNHSFETAVEQATD